MENLKTELAKHVLGEANEYELTHDQAFNRVVSKWLGYDLNSENIVDGSGDRGIDFWYTSDSNFYIFQVKSHDLTETGSLNCTRFDKEGVLDLHRIKTYLLDEEGIPEHNNKLKSFKDKWSYAINSKRLYDEDENENEIETAPITVNLNLIVVGEGLTEQAKEEFDAFERSVSSVVKVANIVLIEFRVNLITIEDILKAKWKEENREWKNFNGKKQDWIELHPENGEFVKGGASSVVFYCRAIDLVMANQSLGYQIFEPNVRCNIKKSKVNLAIKESIKKRVSRKEFRLLNNGITMTCNNFKKPSQNRKSFKVFEPGVVNGLQTVVSISEAFNELPEVEKDDFINNCYVLVRLLQDNAVRDVHDVVRATNTQNKMEARNLLSNNPEQILYEKLFAELGWFYERKQGAWHAFAMDPSRWRSVPNKRKIDFLTNPNDGRSRQRLIDNEELAQSWFSFIGFSDLAIHEKSQIFEKSDWYNVIFLNRPQKHGGQLEYNIHNVMDNSYKQAPSPELLMCAFLARRFAKEITLSPKENFEKTCKRLNIDYSKKSKEEVIYELSKDSEYLLGLALSGMSFTFVDYFGYIMYRSFGEKIHDIGAALLQNRTLGYLKDKFSYNDIRESVNNEDFMPDDILCVVWYSFKHVISEMLSGFWAESFRSTTNRSRFIASKDTRLKMINGLEELHKYTCKVQLARLWASNIKINRGIYGFVQDQLVNKN